MAMVARVNTTTAKMLFCGRRCCSPPPTASLALFRGAATVASSRLSDQELASVRSEVGAARRVVVKMGTAVVTHDGVEVALGRVSSIVEQVAQWQRRGVQPVIVSSGSIGLGATALGLAERPRSLGMRQACAAVGQGHLINFYSQSFAQLGVKVAQVLLTNEDLADRDRALCFRTTILRLIELGVVPILNENDSVSVRELLESTGTSGSTAFGDNDGLAARVATAIDADLLILLTVRATAPAHLHVHQSVMFAPTTCARACRMLAVSTTGTRGQCYCSLPTCIPRFHGAHSRTSTLVHTSNVGQLRDSPSIVTCAPCFQRGSNGYTPPGTGD